MHDHRETLALAAAAIDFELDPTERAQLDAALESCSLCRRQASAMRATATILRRPSDIGTPGRVRDVVIGAALRGGRRTPALRPLLAASLCLLVVLGGTAVIVGNRGFGILPPESPSSPAPVQTASATATPLPTPEPQPTPGLVATPTAVPPSADANGPLEAGDTAAMVTDGRVVIRTQPGTGADSAIFKTKLYPGQRVLTLEGPVEASGYPWFRVRLGDIEGWAAAASVDGEPWLAPVRNGVIAFVREIGGNDEAIYTIAADGTTGEAILFADPSLIGYEQLTWSPDGRRLAFVATPADAGNGSTEVYTIDADGSNLVQITQNEVDDDSPAWSPDGALLALRVGEVDPGAPGASNVVVATAVGRGVTVLGPGSNPVWSPDGLQVAMTVAEGGSSRIWVQAPDGGGRRQVADVSVASSRPAWSPEGQRLVFSSSGLFLAEVATGSITRLTVEPGSMPKWSIGGTVAFSTTGSASPSVFLIDPDGSNLRLVASVAAVPDWSPDGRQLLLASGSSLGVVEPKFVDPDRPGSTHISDITNGRSFAWQPLLP